MIKSSLNLNASLSPFNQVNAIVDAKINDIYTALPVKVVAVNAPYVDVKSTIYQIDNKNELIDQPIIYNVPYTQIQGGKNAIIIEPKVGDLGFCVFCQRDISAFKATKNYALPGSKRTYNPSDAIYIGGILNEQPERYVKITDDGVEIYGDANVTVKADNVQVEATNAVIKAQDTTIDSPVTKMVGNLLVAGGIAWGGEASGIDGAPAKFNTQIISTKGIVTTDDVVSGGISLQNHTHTAPDRGGQTTPPNR